MYGAVPPDGVKLIAPVAEPHCDWVKMNSPFTPPFTVKVGNLPHFGEMLFGSNGHVTEGVDHAPQTFEIFIMSPQV